MSHGVCCCCSNKTGSQVVGIFDIVVGIIAVLLGFVVLFGSVAIANHQNKDADLFIRDDRESAMIHTIAAAVFFCGGVHILFGCILMYAINRESEQCMKFWIISKITILILEALFVIYKMKNNFSETGILGNVLGLAFSVWFIAVVYCHRQDIYEGRSRNKGTVYQIA